MGRVLSPGGGVLKGGGYFNYFGDTFQKQNPAETPQPHTSNHSKADSRLLSYTPTLPAGTPPHTHARTHAHTQTQISAK